MPLPAEDLHPGFYPSDPTPAPTPALQFVPQFDAPFRFDRNGQPAVVEQDTPEEVGAAVYNILSCVQGGMLGNPGFGRPDPLFQPAPFDLSGILSALQVQEPRGSYQGSEALTNVAQIVQAVIGGALPGARLPGATDFPAQAESTQIVEGGPGTVDVAIGATVPKRPT